jgi:drug/metabolite transporter superfamily protein YnfA
MRINKGKNMKNLFKKISFGAAVILMAGVAHAEGPNMGGLCGLISELKNVFNILRTLAFVGAAFVIASIGWDAIVAKKYDWSKDGKQHLIAMIIGFVLLFSVGIILTFLADGKLGCAGGTW